MTALQATLSSSETIQSSGNVRSSKYVERHKKRIEGRRFIPHKKSVLEEKSSLKSVEGAYKYNRSRPLTEYEFNFGYTFTSYCEVLRTLSNVTVLDSGAGQGVAMQDLITRVKSIERCTCVTKHLFEEIDCPVKVKEKMKWVFGRSEDYLFGTMARFNLITDLFGAYAYSPDRDKLIEQYYNHLKVGGKAFVLLVNRDNLKNIIRVGDRAVRLEEYLVEKYPASFKILYNFDVLEITKTDRKEIALGLRRTTVVRRDNLPSDPHSKKEKHELDILYPYEVHFELKV